MNHKDFLTPGSWNLTSNNSRNIHKTRLLSFIAIFFVALIFILKAKTLSPQYYWYIFAAAITAVYMTSTVVIGKMAAMLAHIGKENDRLRQLTQLAFRARALIPIVNLPWLASCLHEMGRIHDDACFHHPDRIGYGRLLKEYAAPILAAAGTTVLSYFFSSQNLTIVYGLFAPNALQAIHAILRKPLDEMQFSCSYLNALIFTYPLMTYLFYVVFERSLEHDVIIAGCCIFGFAVTMIMAATGRILKR